MSSVASFLPVASNQLLKDTTGIMLDYLGTGFSNHSDTFPYTLEAHAEAVVQVIEQIGYSSCHFVGHSFGGALAIQVAFQRSDSVKSLLIAEGNLITGGLWEEKYCVNFKNRFYKKCVF